MGLSAAFPALLATEHVDVRREREAVAAAAQEGF